MNGLAKRSTITRRARLNLERLDARDVPAVGFHAIGSGFGSLPLVTVTRPDGSTLASIMAYDPSFRGGVNATVAELDGNPNTVEVITGAGRTGGPHVKVFSIDTQFGHVMQIASFFAFDANFRGGVRVAAADRTGSGTQDLVVATGPGSTPEVKSYAFHNGMITQLSGPLGDFVPFAQSFRGGVNLSAGNLDNNLANGEELVLNAAGTGSINVLNAAGPFAQFQAAVAGNSGGIFLDPITTNGQLVIAGGNGAATMFVFSPNGTFTRTLLSPDGNVIASFPQQADIGSGSATAPVFFGGVPTTAANPFGFGSPTSLTNPFGTAFPGLTLTSTNSPFAFPLTSTVGNNGSSPFDF